MGRFWNFLNFEIQIETFELVPMKYFAIIEFCITVKVDSSENCMDSDKFSIGDSNFFASITESE